MALSPAISHIAYSTEHMSVIFLQIKETKHYHKSRDGAFTLIASCFSCCISPWSILFCISSMMTGLLLPFTKTLYVFSGTHFRKATCIQENANTHTYRRPGNFSSYASLRLASFSPSPGSPSLSCACSFRLCSESTFFSPSLGCADNISSSHV